MGPAPEGDPSVGVLGVCVRQPGTGRAGGTLPEARAVRSGLTWLPISSKAAPVSLVSQLKPHWNKRRVIPKMQREPVVW